MLGLYILLIMILLPIPYVIYMGYLSFIDNDFEIDFLIEYIFYNILYFILCYYFTTGIITTLINQ